MNADAHKMRITKMFLPYSIPDSDIHLLDKVRDGYFIQYRVVERTEFGMIIEEASRVPVCGYGGTIV